MTMHTDANSFSTANSAAQQRADLLGRALDRRITSGAGLVFGEGAIGGAEPQREGQRLAVLANLRTGVHVEQPDILQQLPRAVANRVFHRLRGEVGVHDESGQRLGTAMYIPAGKPNGPTDPGEGLLMGLPPAIQGGGRYAIEVLGSRVSFVVDRTAGEGAAIVRFR